MGRTHDPKLGQNKLFMVETCPFALPNSLSFHMVVLENKSTIQIPKKRWAHKQRWVPTFPLNHSCMIPNCPRHQWFIVLLIHVLSDKYWPPWLYLRRCGNKMVAHAITIINFCNYVVHSLALGCGHQQFNAKLDSNSWVTVRRKRVLKNVSKLKFPILWIPNGR
jgi:hypothetical protein